MTRTDSVRTALTEVGGEALVVLVHDAARPLLHDDVIGRVLAPLSEGFEGVIPALAVADTLKRADGGIVTETVDRSGLVAAQTPQAFEAGALRAALAGDTATATDCASLVERNGGRIRVVDGDPRLLKVTTPLDLELIEQLL
jgi:2-C-methyl-D-erythritol 4-phosphate cytidylyltransferase